MPKQRHHQHHRQRGIPPTGLRLPQTTFSKFLNVAGTRFPDGWVPRPLNIRPLLLAFVGAAAAVTALAALAVLAIWLFGGH